eukprot:1161482-Pelagomonas_calceolata.AAC.5
MPRRSRQTYVWDRAQFRRRPCLQGLMLPSNGTLNLSIIQAQCYLRTLATRHPDPSIVHALLGFPGYTPPTAAQHASIGCQR